MDQGQWAHDFISNGWQLTGLTESQIQDLCLPSGSIPTEYHFTEFERQVRRETVQKYASLGIIEKVPGPTTEDDGLYHSFICVLNKEEARGCLSCTKINEHIPYVHFKMEGLHTEAQMIHGNDYMTKFDTSDFYHHHQRLHEQVRHQRLLSSPLSASPTGQQGHAINVGTGQLRLHRDALRLFRGFKIGHQALRPDDVVPPQLRSSGLGSHRQRDHSGSLEPE